MTSLLRSRNLYGGRDGVKQGEVGEDLRHDFREHDKRRDDPRESYSRGPEVGWGPERFAGNEKVSNRTQGKKSLDNRRDKPPVKLFVNYE